MLSFARSLFGRVVLALVGGVALGVLAPGFAASLRPLGDGFIKLVTMLIAPLVFCVVVHGIAGSGDLKKAGRLGLKAIVYFEAMTTVALLIGAAFAFLLRPGRGMNIDVSKLDTGSLSTYTERARGIQSISSFLLNLIPSTIFDAFTRGDILQVLLVALLFGCALSLIGERAQRVSSLVDDIGQVLFRIMGFIIQLAPIGVFGSVAFTAARYGIGSLRQLALLVLVFYASCAAFILLLLGAVLRLAGLNVFRFIRYFREELTIVLGTGSSDAVLPQVMRKLERLGIEESTVGLVIPLGYSFNLDGFSIYLTLAVIFIAQATNSPLQLRDLALIIFVSLITSKGAHGIPGSAIVILAATLSAIPGIPVLGLVLILPVDWFIGLGRAVTNLLGNCVATVVVARWKGETLAVSSLKVV